MIQCPGCERCEGAAHHWQSAVDAEGLPLFSCKHCPAEFAVLNEGLIEVEEEYGGAVCGLDSGAPGGDHTARVVVRRHGERLHVESIQLVEETIVRASERYL